MNRRELLKLLGLAPLAPIPSQVKLPEPEPEPKRDPYWDDPYFHKEIWSNAGVLSLILVNFQKGTKGRIYTHWEKEYPPGVTRFAQGTHNWHQGEFYWAPPDEAITDAHRFRHKDAGSYNTWELAVPYVVNQHKKESLHVWVPTLGEWWMEFGRELPGEPFPPGSKNMLGLPLDRCMRRLHLRPNDFIYL